MATKLLSILIPVWVFFFNLPTLESRPEVAVLNKNFMAIELAPVSEWAREARSGSGCSCTNEHRPVCGNRGGLEYRNICLFKCAQRMDSQLRKVPCDPKAKAVPGGSGSKKGKPSPEIDADGPPPSTDPE